jgi:hypothetical protein
MPTRTDLRNQVTVTQLIAASRVTDATPVVSTALDRSALPAGSRHMLVLSAFETNVANTGGVWTVTESATSGGSYTAATTSTIAATPATAGNDVQSVDVTPSGTKPWLKVTYTGADANAEVDITASLVRVAQAI